MWTAHDGVGTVEEVQAAVVASRTLLFYLCEQERLSHAQHLSNTPSPTGLPGTSHNRQYALVVLTRRHCVDIPTFRTCQLELLGLPKVC